MCAKCGTALGLAEKQTAPIGANGFAPCECLVTNGCLPNMLKGKQMQIDPEFIIRSIDDTAQKHYREGESDQVDRLARQVGALSAKIRELSALLQYTVDQLNELKAKDKQ